MEPEGSYKYVHKTEPILSQFNPAHILTSYFSKMYSGPSVYDAID
jgi:hypothetical protein